MRKSILLLITTILIPIHSIAQHSFSLKSPDDRIKVDISVSERIEYSVSHDDDIMLEKSAISMVLDNGKSLGIIPQIKNVSERSNDDIIIAKNYKKNQIIDKFNELTINFKGNYCIIFRIYNDGVAYRFSYDTRKPFKVKSEQTEFNFPENCSAYVPYVKTTTHVLEDQYFNSFENLYSHIKLSEWVQERIAFAPIVVESVHGKKICITESDLLNYPGMFLNKGNKPNGIKGTFAPYPRLIEQGGYNNLQEVVKTREQYLAMYDHGSSFPWRCIIIATEDKELANNDMVYKLASPSFENLDYSWVKPGKVVWEWWNNWGLYGVDFRAGINNETYKYYIDFAAKYGFEYVLLDEGWAQIGKNDLFDVVTELDIKELVTYAENKNVGLILWAGYNAFKCDMERACRHYSDIGIKGFKIDFMDRDDQLMVDFHHRAAKICAKYRLLVDFHGTYKPTGLQRTYPNVINFEGVYGLEQMKFKNDADQVTYDVTIPFIRQVAGPIDYTQGAMRNATKDNYSPVNAEAMSQGTRCRQLAQYIIFESPLSMLCDSPSNYMNEEESTQFITEIPTVWDHTLSLNGCIGEYVTIARKKDYTWYLGAMTNWEARTLNVDLSFLGEGEFFAEIFKDGVNADKVARDYQKIVVEIPENRHLRIEMAPGGGYVAKIQKKNNK